MALSIALALTLQFLPQAAWAGQGMLMERVGSSIPADIGFVDETGGEITLGSLSGTPLLISLVYHDCDSICPKLLGDIAEAASVIDLEPGADYRLVTISFDERDTPETAARLKRNFVAAAGTDFPGYAWRFLTGSRGNILRFTEAAGFSFRRAGEGFIHPRALIVVSAEGRIVRYLPAGRVLPGDLKMAIREASGKNWLMSYCFRYDAAEGRYVYNTVRVLLTLAATAAAFAVSWVWYVRHREEGCRAG